MKNKSIKRLKFLAWKEFSLYIRKREANNKGLAPCITCGKRFEWQSMDAGHFVGGRHNSVLFDPRNCHQQCTYCNRYLHGNVLVYNDVLIQRYGIEVVMELRRKDREIKRWTSKELLEIWEHYKNLNQSTQN